MYPVLFLHAATAPASAADDRLADGYGANPNEPLRYPLSSVAPLPTEERTFDLEFGVRVRRMALPNAILDRFYADQDSADWPYIDARPRIEGTSLGLELGLRGRSATGTFYVEWVDSAMRPGYWDDADDDPLDGNFLSPSNGLGLVTVGANSAYELRLLRPEQTNGIYGLSLVMGGGLGLGVLAGRVERWTLDEVGRPSYVRYLDGVPADATNGVSRLYPLLDVNIGVRSSFGDLVGWRVEAGLHTLPYVGTSLVLGF